jgi:transglutaminase-like putative cysteine protease
MTAVLDTPPQKAAPIRRPEPAAGAGPRRRQWSVTWRPTIVVAIAVALATIGLTPIFADLSWLTWPLLEIVVIAAVGGLLAVARVPLFLVPVTQAFVVLCVLIVGFVPDAPLRFIPSPDALAELHATLQQGTNTISTSGIPVAVGPGIVCLTALGIGAMAMVTHVLAVCLTKPVLAGAPLLATYIVPAVTLSTGAPWWGFLLTAGGWLLILTTDARLSLSRWGRLLPRSTQSGAGVPGLAGAATRLGVIALACALVVPVLIPNLADQLFAGYGRGPASDTGSGSNGTSAGTIGLDPLVTLRRDLLSTDKINVMSYTTTSTQPSYLRTAALEQFDGSTFKIAQLPDSLPSVQDALQTLNDGNGTATYVLKSTKFSSQYLPTPYHPTVINIAGDWRLDQTTSMVVSQQGLTNGAKWTVTADQTEPSVAELRAATETATDAQQFSTLTSQYPANIKAQALQVTAGAQTSYDMALDLQTWFRTNFTYSTNFPSKNSADYLQQFLHDRIGYCEQFASAMALLARSLGIPARVAIGFTPGTKDASGGYIVTTQDAHAWPELWFHNIGWIRFEPTPRSGAAGGDVSAPAYARPADSGTVGPSTPSNHATMGRPDSRTNRIRESKSPGGTSDASAALDTAQPGSPSDTLRRAALLALLVMGLICLATPAAIRWRRRHGRLGTAGTPEAAWAEVRDTVVDLGQPWSDADTPRQAVARLTAREELTEPVAASINRIARATERSRYARTVEGSGELASDVRRVRAHLTGRLDRRFLWRTTLFPASVLHRI